MSNTWKGTWFIAVVLLSAACAPAVVAPPAPAPAPGPAPAPPAPVRPVAPSNPALPAIPLSTGPLSIDVVYPGAGQTIGSRDSAFIFGSVGHGEALLTINGTPAPVWPNGAFMAFLPIPPRDNPAYDIVAVVGADTARLVHQIRLLPEPAADPVVTPPPVPPVDTVSNRWGIVVSPTAADPDRVVWGPAIPDPDTLRYFLIPGTALRVVSPSGARLRVELDSGQGMTVAAGDLQLQPTGFAPPVRTAGAPRVIPGSAWIDVEIPVTSPPPYLFTSDGNVLRLTLYGTRSERRGDTTGVMRLTAGRDSLLPSVERSHSPTRSMYAFNLARDVYGYAVSWDNGQLTVRIRRPPPVDAAEPLRGLTIAVDPGHPGLPGESPGATGPTGLREPDAVLAVGLRLRDMLVERGAIAFMTRSTPDPVPLNFRAAEAARQNSHAYVSIHLNAVPDNVNPFHAHGTSTYYWHPHSARLAETSHDAMLRHMHLRDIGVRRENFALVRNPWMPSILAEGAFIIMPDQEYALRTPEYQEAYARALLEGLEAYFREIAAGR
jgi:N-acetylmuramoyl-L-alanine amidase